MANRENILTPITLQDVERGYRNGTIYLIDCPHSDGTACQIGEYWFYFGDKTTDDYTSEEYRKRVPEDEIVSNIFEALEEMRNLEDFENEYWYYRAVLAEAGTIKE